MSSANEVRILMAGSLRFLEEGSSAPSQSGAKVRPEGVADAQTVEIPSPPKHLSAGTLLKGQSRVLVPVEIEGNISTEVWLDERREKLRGYVRCPYRKPTQVGRKKILRPTGEGLLRNSAS